MYFIKRIREEKKKTFAKPSGEAQFDGMIYGGGLHFVGGEPYTVDYDGGGARSSAREGGRGQRQKKRETEHGGSGSGVLCQTAVEGGGSGSGGEGGGDARRRAREGEKLGPKKTRNPSAPARFRVCPVKRQCRVVEGGSGV